MGYSARYNINRGPGPSSVPFYGRISNTYCALSRGDSLLLKAICAAVISRARQQNSFADELRRLSTAINGPRAKIVLIASCRLQEATRIRGDNAGYWELSCRSYGLFDFGDRNSLADLHPVRQAT